MWHMTCDTWNVTHDTWHVTCDTWHMTHEMLHMTHDTWHMEGGEHSLKSSGPSLIRLGSEGVLKILLWRCQVGFTNILVL